MKLFVACILLAACISVAHAEEESLKVCSFNVQIFGQNKARNAQVMEILGKIFSRYDLCLIQEIRDTSDASIHNLLNKINGNTHNYGLIVSNRLGRTNSKEQYAFFYNKKKLKVVDSFHFDDEKHGDLFEREPFIVRFNAENAPVKDFFIAGIHTSPESAREEIASLVQAYNDAVKRFKIEDGIIMGDYNAGCSYFPKKDWKYNQLRQDDRFTWLIGDDADTTVGTGRCAYDRVVVAGSNLKEHVKSAYAYYYDADMNIKSPLNKQVSDHYPVEFEIE